MLSVLFAGQLAWASAWSVVEEPSRPTTAVLAPPRRERTVFLRTRLIVLPSFVFAHYLRSFSNALCRREPGKIARKRGINRTDTCNGSAELGMRWRSDKVWFEASAFYARLGMPDSNWVAQGEDVAAADLTQIGMHLLGINLGLSREYVLGKTSSRWRWYWGGQLGFALLRGHIYRTKLGAQPSTCSFDQLGDLSLCRPFRAVEFNEPDRNPRFFARCSAKACDPHDLQRAGRNNEALPRFVPLIGVSTGPRVWVHPQVAISGEFGLGLGLFGGLSLDVRLPTANNRPARIAK